MADLNNDISVKEILEVVSRNLSNISVPVGLMQQIGLPIVQSIGNLQLAAQKLDSADETSPEKVIEENEHEDCAE